MSWSETFYILKKLASVAADVITGNGNISAIKNDVENATTGLPSIKTAVDNANSTLGNGTYGLSAIKTAVDAIGSGGSGSVIKSIQRGTTSQSSGALTVNISSVDPSKSIIIITRQYGNMGVQVGTLLSSSFTLTFSGVSGTCHWQVIEFN